jgi:ring-1,2-phenylacetyl-CoA epoxidase subunit PaaC
MAQVEKDSLPPTFGDLILGLRESKQILAREMTMWSVRAPTLETGIALAALAQDELGHAQRLAALHASKFVGERDHAERVSFNDALTHPAVRPFAPRTGSWPEMVALMCLWDSAVTTILEAAAASSYAPMRNAVARMCDHEVRHWIFAHGAASDLLARDGRVPEALREACIALWPRVQKWFGEIGDLGALFQAGLLSGTAPTERYASRIGPFLEEMKITLPEPATANA